MLATGTRPRRSRPLVADPVAPSGWPSSSRRSTRGSTTQTARASTTPTRCGPSSSKCRSRSLRGYIGKVAARRRDRHADRGDHRRARPGDRPSTWTCSTAKTARRSRANSACRRTVFHYVENHNFYVEHWGHSVMWRKMRELSSVLVKEGFWADIDDIFMLKKDGDPDRDRRHDVRMGCRCEARRARTLAGDHRQARDRSWRPARRGTHHRRSAVPPEVVSASRSRSCCGASRRDSIQKWLGGMSDTGGLSGFAASPGVVEGIARVLTRPIRWPTCRTARSSSRR